MPTPYYALPFPAAGSTVDVPRDIEALARATDTVMYNNFRLVPAVEYLPLLTNNLASGGVLQQTFTAHVSAGGPLWRVKAGDATTLECLQSGLYLVGGTIRAHMPTLRTTGFVQWGIAGLVDTCVPQGGAAFADVHIPAIQAVFTAGSSTLRGTVTNNTGAVINLIGPTFLSLVLISPL